MIMPKRGPWGSEYPVSRDWANDIPCKNKDCLLNGGGRCVVLLMCLLVTQDGVSFMKNNALNKKRIKTLIGILN